MSFYLFSINFLLYLSIFLSLLRKINATYNNSNDTDHYNDNNNEINSLLTNSLCLFNTKHNDLLLTNELDNNIIIKNGIPYYLAYDDSGMTIHCSVEAVEEYEIDDFPVTELKIVEYNIDINGYGLDSEFEIGHEAIINALYQFKQKEEPDVIVIIEAARNCAFAGAVNFGEVLSKKLEMNFYYSVESLYYRNKKYGVHIESLRNMEYDDNNANSTKETGNMYKFNKELECTIGNLVLTNKKVTRSVAQYYLNDNCCDTKERFNIKNSLNLDFEIEIISNYTNSTANNDVISDINNDAEITIPSVVKEKIRISSTHLEAGKSDLKRVFQSAVVRERQLNQIAKEHNKVKDEFKEIFIVGDLNSPLIYFDLSLYSIYYHYNYQDAFSSHSYFSRNTCPFAKTAKFGFANLDYIFSLKENNFVESVILDEESEYSYFYGIADHHPIYIKYSFLNNSNQ